MPLTHGTFQGLKLAGTLGSSSARYHSPTADQNGQARDAQGRTGAVQAGAIQKGRRTISVPQRILARFGNSACHLAVGRLWACLDDQYLFRDNVYATEIAQPARLTTICPELLLTPYRIPCHYDGDQVLRTCATRADYIFHCSANVPQGL